VSLVSILLDTSHAIVSVSCDLTSRDDVLRIAKEIQQKEPAGIHVLVSSLCTCTDHLGLT
jgi:hypothetical protein